MINGDIGSALLKFAHRIATSQHHFLDQTIGFAYGGRRRVDKASLGLFPAVGKSVLLVCGQAANIQIADTLLALGQRGLGSALIAALIARARVFWAELPTQI